jgi:tetraacyldisaccharide 4'-kinase
MVLAPFAWLFNILVWCRNLLFDHGFLKEHRLPGFVISIGNIAVGGTGKSPLVIDFCQRILAEGGSPAIVSRGYRSGLRSNEWQVLVNGEVVAGVSRQNVVADEAIMQSRALAGVPVIVGARRLNAVNGFLAGRMDKTISHWILDDGFQHRKIFRELNVVVLDARQPSGRLMPAGFFREPISALRRAQVAVITKAESTSQIERTEALILKVAPTCQVLAVSFDSGAPKCAYSGVATQGNLAFHTTVSTKAPSDRWAMVSSIARPEDFLASLAVQGITPVERFIYPDHRSIHPDEISRARHLFDFIITTEKDWARDAEKFNSLGVPIFILPLVVRWLSSAPVLTVRRSPDGQRSEP